MPEHIYETIIDQTIAESEAAPVVDVSGFRRYSILARFEGTPNGEFRVEINNDNLLVGQESLRLNESGWLNFRKEYKAYGPRVGVVIYHPPGELKVRMSLYAGL